MAYNQILITGSNGFLGSWVAKEIISQNLFSEVITIDRDDFDLTDETSIKQIFKKYRPDVLINCAGILGGIDFMQQYPGEIFFQNTKMNILLMEYSRINDVKKFIQIGSASEYPESQSIPFKERQLWDGLPEKIIRPYAMAKKIQIIQQEAYFIQYGFKSIHLILPNLYGPGDHFTEDRSHVIPSMIRKIFFAKNYGKKEVVFWGDGSQKREFLFIKDAAEAIIKSINYNSIQPLNIGSEEEITIKDLSNFIKDIIDFKGVILWDTNKPSGQERRKLDTLNSHNSIGFKASVTLYDGLNETIKWYKKNILTQDAKQN